MTDWYLLLIWAKNSHYSVWIWSKPCSVIMNFQTLPKSFVKANGLETRCGEIVLINEKGISWKLNLKPKRSCGTMYITRGWRSFCRVNGLRAGSFFTFKLIQRRGTLVLRLSSQFENKFVTLTLNPSNLTSYPLVSIITPSHFVFWPSVESWILFSIFVAVSSLTFHQEAWHQREN